MAELVRYQLANNIDYSNSDIIRSYTYKGKTEGHIRLGYETQSSTAVSGYSSLNVRIHFKTDEYGASSLSWGLKEQVLFYPAYENSAKLVWQNGICYYQNANGGKLQLTGAFRYAITEDPNALIRTDWTWTSFGNEDSINAALDESGYIIRNENIDIEQYDNQTEYCNIGGSCDVELDPNKDYYLWLYVINNPATQYRLFMITGYWDPPLLTVESHGAGRTHVRWDNGHSGYWDNSYTIGNTIYFENLEDDESELRNGYTFIGWNTKNNGSGTTYYPGDTIVAAGGHITFHAVWSANYTIKYNDNGATFGHVPNTQHTEKIASPLASNTFERQYVIYLDGNGGTVSESELYVQHHANGWEYSGRHYQSDQMVTGLTAIPNDIITMYANWDLQSTTLPSATRSGYRLVEWNTAADGSGVTYKRGSNITPIEDMTLYAQWITNGSHNLSIFIKVDGQWKTSTTG